MIFMRLKALFSKGVPLRSLVPPELCTRQHMWSVREKSLEILRHGQELNPEPRPRGGQTVRYPTELSWPGPQGGQAVSYSTELSKITKDQWILRWLTLVRVPAIPWHWSRELLSPDTGQGTCYPLAPVRVPAIPWHWSGQLQAPNTDAIPLSLCPWITQIHCCVNWNLSHKMECKRDFYEKIKIRFCRD